MKTHQYLTALSMLVFGCAALSACAADRMSAGQWVGTTVAGGRTFSTSSCISQSDADAINGDAKAVGAYLEKIIPPSMCTISDIKAEGRQIVYTASCGGTGARVVTTTYHGDSSEGTDNKGTTSQAKLVGPCK